MAIKCDDDRESVLLSRIGDGLADDLLMPQMDAIKDSDGEASFAPGSVELIGVLDEFHATASFK